MLCGIPLGAIDSAHKLIKRNVCSKITNLILPPYLTGTNGLNTVSSFPKCKNLKYDIPSTWCDIVIWMWICRLHGAYYATMTLEATLSDKYLFENQSFDALWYIFWFTNTAWLSHDGEVWRCFLYSCSIIYDTAWNVWTNYIAERPENMTSQSWQGGEISNQSPISLRITDRSPNWMESSLWSHPIHDHRGPVSK